MPYLDKNFIGKKLKEYRKKANLTQGEVSIQVQIDEKHYGKLERGVFLPGLDTFFRLIEILKIPLNEFGINLAELEDDKRTKLVKQIYLSSEKEIEIFSEILKFAKKLK